MNLQTSPYGILDSSQAKVIREWALHKIQTVSFPRASDEIWRKFPIQKMDLSELGFTKEKSSNSFQLEIQTEKISNAKTSNSDSESSLSQVTIPPTKFEFFFNEFKNSIKENYFSLLTLALTKEYRLVLIETGNEQEIHFDSQQSSPDLQVTFVYVMDSANAKIKSSLNSRSLGKLHFISGLQYLFLEPNSSVDFLNTENLDEDCYHLYSHFISIESSAQVRFHYFPTGGFKAKKIFGIRLLGKESFCEFTGVSVFRGREFSDMDVTAEHYADYTDSKISFKTIVSDRAHHLFTGNLYIPPKLKKVTAHQESFNLSLNPKARAEANPKLEVYSEDVSCTHGATVGDINEDQYFYLLSRGLTPEESKALLVEAFYGESIEKINFSEEVKSKLHEEIRIKIVGGN